MMLTGIGLTREYRRAVRERAEANGAGRDGLAESVEARGVDADALRELAAHHAAEMVWSAAPPPADPRAHAVDCATAFAIGFELGLRLPRDES